MTSYPLPVRHNIRYQYWVTASLTLLFGLFCQPCLSFAGTDEGAILVDQGRILTVTGKANVQVEPDIAYIRLGVVSEDADASIAQRRNAEQMSQIIAQLKNAGIPPEDIRTIAFHIYQRYGHNRDRGESRVDGYTVNSSIQITVRDMSRAGDTLDIASRYGMNISEGITFGLRDPETPYRRALKEAGNVASGRAQALAEGMGIVLKGPVSITEGRAEPAPQPVRVMPSMAESNSTPVESGTMTIEASVTVVYEF